MCIVIVVVVSGACLRLPGSRVSILFWIRSAGVLSERLTSTSSSSSGIHCWIMDWALFDGGYWSRWANRLAPAFSRDAVEGETIVSWLFRVSCPGTVDELWVPLSSGLVGFCRARVGVIHVPVLRAAPDSCSRARVGQCLSEPRAWSPCVVEGEGVRFLGRPGGLLFFIIVHEDEGAIRCSAAEADRPTIFWAGVTMRGKRRGAKPRGLPHHHLRRGEIELRHTLLMSPCSWFEHPRPGRRR